MKNEKGKILSKTKVKLCTDWRRQIDVNGRGVIYPICVPLKSLGKKRTIFVTPQFVKKFKKQDLM